MKKIMIYGSRTINEVTETEDFYAKVSSLKNQF